MRLHLAKAGGEVSGRIINTTSGTGLFGNIGQANYGAAKAGIANLTMITAMEMERYSVTANAISPLAFTRMLASARSRESTEEGQWDPLDPANSSPVVAWLGSRESAWLTGAVLRISGNAVQRVRPWSVESSESYWGKPERPLEAKDIGAGMRRLFEVSPRGLPEPARR